ncbi:MAG TPA: response regulator [Candidatus Acidoferrum sp.]|jgi:signal transduction histidine kinase
MNTPLRVLIVEDSEDDSDLLVRELRRGGYDVQFERVETAAAFKSTCDSQDWQLIVSDFAMPHFSGIEALSLAKKKRPDIPFIFVSGTMGEETSVNAMRNGAHDYLVKGNLQRLVPAVQRELRDAEERRERKRLELHVNQLQRLDAIGRLAGGVAHDFNNLLGVILGQSEILLDRSKDPSSVHGLEMIRDSARRGATLTRQLLAFGRRQVLETRVLNLNMVLADLEKLLRRVIGENIELQFQTEEKLCSTEADPGQIEQVIVNLAINARDAMPDGGKLTIATANLVLDEAYADRRAVVKPGRYVQVVVSDTGCGMDQETQARLFEPFFTTKELGKGTGLGLATVYGIVKQSGGYIWVYSEVGHGTAFKIFLPMVMAAAEGTQYAEPTDQVPRGSETILMVEDDASLREVTAEFLHSSGYTVLAAASPDEALRLSHSHAGQIDFLLTDIIMPKMNGRELATKLSESRPDMKVLYVSGYADGIVRDGVHGKLDDTLAFLQKPYTRRALMRKIRDILDSHAVKSLADKR